MKYYITYSIVTEESAQDGDYAEYGEVGETDRLAEALDWLFATRTAECDGIESTSGSFSAYGGRLTLAVFNGMEFRTGDQEQRGLHVHGISESSAKRIAKLADIPLDCY